MFGPGSVALDSHWHVLPAPTLATARRTRGEFEVDLDTDVDIDVLFDALVRPSCLRLESDAYEITVIVAAEDATDADEDVDYGDLAFLLPASELFRRLAGVLELSTDELRLRLHAGMQETGTRPDRLEAEELWFLLPSIERELLAPMAEDAAELARRRLQLLLRTLAY